MSETIDDYDNLTEEQKILRKIDIIRKLGELALKGETISENYNLDSNYKIMKAEYDIRTQIKSKFTILNWISRHLKMIIKDLKIFNNNYNPFMKFNDSWSAIDDYDNLSEEQKILRKMDIIRKLGELALKGETISENYNLDSNYKIMKAEYNRLILLDNI
jgi:hypothetical protein